MAKLITLFNLLPKAHQITLALLAIFTFVILLLPSEDAQASKQTANKSTQLETNTRYSVPLAFRSPTAPNAASSSQESQAITTDDIAFAEHLSSMSSSSKTDQVINQIEAEVAQQKSHQQTEQPVEYYEVTKGDTLGGLFKRAGLTAKDVYDITQLPIAKKNLLKIIPGEEIAIRKTDDGNLAELSYRMDKISTLVITKQNDKYQETVTKKELETRQSFITANIKTSFWNAAIDAGLSANHIMQLANVFGWDIDFALDIRKNDHFSLLFEQEFADGEFVRTGNILAAEFVNQGERYTAVRYTDGEYYSENGSSMRKAFLRSPVDFNYVSSNFNPRRLHPVTGQVKAHRGVDYVAAIGTPIKAAGRGKVTEAGYNQYNGHYVFIKHNDTYTTKYLHLNKRKVKRGDTVKQGQIIGTLGRSGRVTGAHLHYEFIVNGVHRNPRTVNLPKSEPIARSEKNKFDALSKQLMAKLKSNQEQQLASN
ncbi:peptidoglycan DD-metalloendopeptidase family protein [Shewanella aestuarii]|uniref:Peptidoglycan DD-metalloendopeptidase family protein n=1 Tax=Shewanella aestuarii TaxID=1028752 RepID=A0A6G9QMH2_9GAMM|nr:peptidoglycan DD-metalloendopeptidase family protein [Shewanella aestuarii]QIR15265.1 peptidoglycan DD-metalloendopeptidase family protein [Shewanella aestuarii]